MNYSVVSQFIGIASKKLFRWHKDVLSWFNDKDAQLELHENDTTDKAIIIKDKITWLKWPVTVYTPIFIPENIWEDMNLDDKNIWWIWYTILSNKKTNKIALLISSTKTDIVFDILRKIPIEVRNKVKTVSRDLALNYESLCRYAFMKSIQIWDKFHVIKLALQALQDVRIRYRQEILTNERKSKKAPIKTSTETLSNWDTIKQLLARSKFVLFMFSSKWNEEQKLRADILFERFSEIKRAYDIICWFRAFYNIKHSQTDSLDKAKISLNEWYEKANDSEIPEIMNFANTVKDNENCILNYFLHWHTNAKAEGLNSRIQRFMWLNYWIRNRNFFHFRMKQYFS